MSDDPAPVAEEPPRRKNAVNTFARDRRLRTAFIISVGILVCALAIGAYITLSDRVVPGEYILIFNSLQAAGVILTALVLIQ